MTYVHIDSETIRLEEKNGIRNFVTIVNTHLLRQRFNVNPTLDCIEFGGLDESPLYVAYRKEDLDIQPLNHNIVYVDENVQIVIAEYVS